MGRDAGTDRAVTDGPQQPSAQPDSGLTTAADGLPARLVRDWSNEKLFYIERYIDIFTTGMKTWRRRVYIDLFSGPGRCFVEESQQEVRGSPLLALDAKHPFTDLYFNDAEVNVSTALNGRVASRVANSRVNIRSLDCNEAARDVVNTLGLDRPGTLGLAVIDPTAFQLSFDALAAMTKGRRIDLIVTLMTGYLRRFLEQPGYERPLDAFFGSSDWRKLIDERATGGKVTYRHLLDSYEDKLRSIGYLHVDDDIRILNSHEQTIYHLVFASKHPKGAEFFKKISRRKYGGQARLDI